MQAKAITSSIGTAIKNSGLNVGDAINVWVATSDYKTARQEGDSKIKSLAKAGVSFAWGEFYYGGLSSTIDNGLKGLIPNNGLRGVANMGLMVGLTAAPAVIQGFSANQQYLTSVNAKALAQRGKFGSGYFNMSEPGYTMRQRSLNAIRQNGLNTQSVLGNEARTYFRS